MGRFEERIAELRAMPREEGDEPISDVAVENARRFLAEPLVGAGSNGEVELNWLDPSGKSKSIWLTVRFLANGEVWVASR